MRRPGRHLDPCVSMQQRGTVLLTTVIVIFAVAAMSAVLMMRSKSNVAKYRQDRRKVQTDYIADSAVSLAIAKLNRDLLPGTNAGSLHGSTVVIHSGESGQSPIVPAGATEWGHPDHDRMPDSTDLYGQSHNVDEDGNYEGGLYRVTIEEWNTKDQKSAKIGATAFDEDKDGSSIDPGDVKQYSTEKIRYFTIEAEATYGNFYIKKRGTITAELTPVKGYGVFSFGDLQVQPNGLIDSYNSQTGSYSGTSSGPPNRRNGSVGATGGMNVKPNTDVYGDARCPSCTADQSYQGDVHGNSGPMTYTPTKNRWSLERDFINTSLAPDKEVSGSGNIIPSGVYRNVDFGGGGGAMNIEKKETMLVGMQGLGKRMNKLYHQPDNPKVHPLLRSGARILQNVGPKRLSFIRFLFAFADRSLHEQDPYQSSLEHDQSSPVGNHTLPIHANSERSQNVDDQHYPFGDRTIPIQGNGNGNNGGGASAKILSGSTVTMGERGGDGTGLLVDAQGSELTIGSQSTLYIQDDWVLGQNSTVVINGPKDPKKEPTQIYIAGDFDGEKMGTIKVRGRVEMNVANEFHMGNKAGDIVVQEHHKNGPPYKRTDKAPWFSLNVGGTWKGSYNTVDKNGKLTLKPNSGIFTGLVNAPKASEMKILPKSDIFGAVIGNDMTPPAYQPMGQLHYDEQLKKSCHLTGITCRWVAAEKVTWIVEHKGGSLHQ